jgi:hypothetical protein
VTGGLGLGTYGTGVYITSYILRQGGPPKLLSDGVDSARNTWMSSDESCVCQGQQLIPYPCGNVDALRRTVQECGLPLSSLADVHTYVPGH